MIGIEQEQDQAPKLSPQLDYRYEGIAKVTGKAKYAAEFDGPFPKADLAYAYIVQATIPAGTVESMDIAAASKAPGVIAVMTPFNAPKLNQGPPQPPARRSLTLLQNKDVAYNGQPIALVIAKTLDQAREAASLVKTTYAPQPPKLQWEKRLGEARWPKNPGKDPADNHRGDIQAAFKKASVVVDNTYVTPIQFHNPMEPHATIAWWEGDKVTVYDATQYISGVKMSLAKTLNIPTDYVRVINPVVGGGFGSKGSMWSHVPLCAMAAKATNRPVKLVLEREQMFGLVGNRPSTINHIRLAAAKDGTLLGIQHDNVMNASVLEDFVEHTEDVAKKLYQSGANSVTAKVVEANLGVSTFMRAPGESSGTAVFEIAMDEMAEKLKMDPIEFRLKNYAEDDPAESHRPWSSKHLKECYAQGAEKFGWASRNTKPGSRAEGEWLIGQGMATATYPANRSAAQAVVRLLPGGKMFVGSGSQDLGTGTYTIMAQQAAAGLGIDPKLVEVKLGDSTLPKAPVSGGSQSAASVLPAIQDATTQLKLKLVDLALQDPKSPMHGLQAADCDVKNGKLVSKSQPGKTDDLTALIARNGNKPVEAQGSAEPGESHDAMTTQSWGAVFVEAAVNRYTGMVKVRRMVAVYDVGVLLNQKTGMNQLMGGLTWGIGFATHEHGIPDGRNGRIVNSNLAEYHVPVNLDVPAMDVSVVGIPDTKFAPTGARGVGEIGITGAAAAVANAIYNATGKRVREYPITPDKLLLA
ncbi:xanthine dehydrogenase family protein molybdopterin-binding subunit [Terriglobus aquaticus]|uniref:Xanthine dehydrogenase family protein molybdopterin-binding subunit n=1 Tax=Terriglobus aquaticus TaxID=940139 RepID=A0ABW9KGU8_9BACT|nr:xanthine dehydrogenase family protein molybdopterin-binding subunit [Terriglobus aquaticus]